MYHSQLAAQFLIEQYRFNQSDRKNLAEVFEAYKNPDKTQTQIPDERTAAAYVIARGLSIAGVMAHIINTEKHFFSKIKNIIDFGGGPGTFLWSLLDSYKEVSYLNIDTNPNLISIFNKIADHLKMNSQATSIQQDYFQYKPPADQFDLAVFSYTLCENPRAIKAVEKALALSQALLIIEPGTPLGYSNILKSRQLLLQHNFNIIAPCSHQQACPLENQGNKWCHFIARNERTKTQMFLKNAEKGYEDEKYIYLIASRKSSIQQDGNRIISRPQLNAHVLSFDICTPLTPTEIKLFKKSDKENFKFYKKAKRGEIFYTQS